MKSYNNNEITYYGPIYKCKRCQSNEHCNNTEHMLLRNNNNNKITYYGPIHKCKRCQSNEYCNNSEHMLLRNNKNNLGSSTIINANNSTVNIVNQYYSVNNTRYTKKSSNNNSKKENNTMISTICTVAGHIFKHFWSG